MTTPLPPAEDHFRYDVMVQEALLGVVRKVLVETARRGLMGEHHFYIAFRSEAPGVKLSARLKEKHPGEMTIVLQHQFWDLAVGEHSFEVGLSFGGVPEKLVIPFDALVGFFDPSVQFGLKFSPDEAAADNDQGERAAPAPGETKKLPRAKKVREEKPGGEKPKEDKTKEDKARGGKAAPAGTAPAVGEETQGEKKSPAGGEVVSLDAFRQKK